MSNRTVVYRSGPSSLFMLTLLFIGLKLAGFIHWSWWWVLSPMWLPWAVILGCFVTFGGVALAIVALIWLYERVTDR